MYIMMERTKEDYREKGESPRSEVCGRRRTLPKSMRLGSRERIGKVTMIRKNKIPKKSPRIGFVDQEEVYKLQSYITTMEVVLDEMKQIVNRKEKSLSLRNSFNSAQTEKNTVPANTDADWIRRKGKTNKVHRRNLFFGENLRNSQPNILERKTSPEMRKSSNIKTEETQHDEKESKSHFSQLIRDCFVTKIKKGEFSGKVLLNRPLLPRSSKVLPSLKPQHVIEDQPGLASKDKTELIEFLTPSQSSQVRLREMGIVIDKSQKKDDSLIYTVSKSKKKTMSRVKPFQGSHSNQEEISGFE